MNKVNNAAITFTSILMNNINHIVKKKNLFHDGVSLNIHSFIYSNMYNTFVHVIQVQHLSNES